MKRKLRFIYRLLYASFGPQHWWPARTPFEVAIGAILTQNTSWLNVEKAIGNLRKHGLLSADRLRRIPRGRLGGYIRSAGYYNVKAGRLKEFLDFLYKTYRGDLGNAASVPTRTLREQLLSVKGIGPETADSILLYALNRPVFVIDAYTRRVLSRHRLVREHADYDQLQKLFSDNLAPEPAVYNEYHALLVKLAKDFCLKSKPRCRQCPLASLPKD
ncbi:MAG TPA: endonuclease III domain-containing protein [Patescibacteria group bacterium]|nr:endonuclease III domain-containing protein [Patescibacteria group bacterium]